MHELSLAQGVVEALAEEAARHGMGQVQRVRLKVGALRAVVPELLHTAMEVAARGTVAHGVVVELEQVAGRARCRGCSEEHAVDDLFFQCPRCGAFGGEVVTGLELQLVEMEGD